MNDALAIDPVMLPVKGTSDARGRLLSADEPLYALQAEAGARLGETIAIPQLGAVVREAIERGRPLRRAIIAASQREDLELRVRVSPDEDGGTTIEIEDWQAHPRGLARFTHKNGSADLTIDARLCIVQIDEALAERFGVDQSSLPRPLTGLVNLTPRRDGSLPLIDALTAGTGFSKQRATVKASAFAFAFSGQPVRNAKGEVEGFALSILHSENPARAQDDGIDATLRSPLTKIISAADQIVERSDGPLRSDYANYAGDIATAGRHLLSVIRTMSGKVAAAGDAETVDLVALAHEAEAMISADARAADVDIEIEEHDGPVEAVGEQRGILQILVNIAGNAIRHSPPGGTVAIVFEEHAASVAITVADQGPGIARADQTRIFEEYERLGSQDRDHAGLGLAISRRLARSMRGDIVLDSAMGEGARFTLKLPRP